MVSFPVPSVIVTAQVAQVALKTLLPVDAAAVTVSMRPAAKSNITFPVPAGTVTVSRSPPPLTTESALSLVRLSFPASPKSWSIPAPPGSESFPAPPIKTFAPVLPVNLSLKADPVRFSTLSS